MTRHSELKTAPTYTTENKMKSKSNRSPRSPKSPRHFITINLDDESLPNESHTTKVVDRKSPRNITSRNYGGLTTKGSKTKVHNTQLKKGSKSPRSPRYAELFSQHQQTFTKESGIKDSVQLQQKSTFKKYSQIVKQQFKENEKISAEEQKK